MICYRNIIFQSGTNPSSLVGVIIFKCFSKEVPMLQRAPVPVLSRRVPADTLLSQRVWARLQKQHPPVNDAWHPLLSSELPLKVKIGRLTHCGAFPHRPAWLLCWSAWILSHHPKNLPLLCQSCVCHWRLNEDSPFSLFLLLLYLAHAEWFIFLAIF